MLNHPIRYGLLFSFYILMYAPVFAQISSIDSLKTSIEKISNDTERVNAYISGALWLNKQIKNSSAEKQLLQQGLDLATKINYLHGIAECKNLLGVFDRESSYYEEAIELHYDALTIAKKLKDSNILAYTLNNLGVAYRRLDENQKAFQYHLEAYKIADITHDQRNLTIAINSIGNIQLSLGNYKEAIGEFNKALAIEQSAGNNLGIAINYANLGAAWEGLDSTDKAIPLYKKSLHYNEKAGSITGIAICCNLLGNAFMKKGDYDLALKYLERALSVHNQVHDKINLAENYITIGKILLKKKQPAHAMASLNYGLGLASQINSRSMMVEGWKAIGEAEKQNHNYQKAFDAMMKAYSYRDSLYIQQSSPEMAKMRTLYEIDKKDNQIKLLQQANQIKKLQLKRHRLIAISSGAVILLGIITLLLYNRQRKIHEHRLALQYELQSLRSQMNPHFIFNSLNSIHKYIWSNEQDQASEYLAKFSKLMRLILENTRFKSVILTNEIEFLYLYLELESLRCNRSFKYEIDVSPELDQEEILVPSMIIQPFVENAIWHGLVYKENGDGTLDIRIYKKEEILYCEIEDNGIGRRKAQKIKKQKLATHQSLGMQVTEERVRLLQEITGNKNTKVDIIDLENDQHQAIGTKVILQLPIEYAY